MGEAAAEGAARADRGMGDVPGDLGENSPQASRRGAAAQGRMAHQRADPQHTVRDAKLIEPLNPVDVDEIAGPREAERHRRHQALAAREDAAVAGRHFGQDRHRFRHRPRPVIVEGRGLHCVTKARAARRGQDAREAVQQRK